MKKGLILFAFLGSCFFSQAQYYGGFTFTPPLAENFSNWSHEDHSIFGGEKTTVGNALGYQGLILPEKRFSIAYGIQYSNLYNEIEYKNPINMYHSTPGSISDVAGESNSRHP